MIPFTQYFKQNDIPTTALLPGGFKPPTVGHFMALESLYKESSQGIVYIGNAERNNITQDMAYEIWSIYAPYLSKPTKIVKSPITPVKCVYQYADEHKDEYILVGVGDKDRDDERYKYFEQNHEKYPNVAIRKIPLQENGISGTDVRNILTSGDPNAIDYFAPAFLSETDKERIKSILNIA